MILSKTIIEDLKSVSGLSFEQFKDLGLLADLIQQKTKRSIGVTTLRRLFGLIDDGHQTYGYTLNTIALYLDYPSWTDYINLSFASENQFTLRLVYTIVIVYGT